MELYHIFRRTRVVLSALCIIIAILVSSCRAGEPQDPDRDAALSLLAPLEIATGRGEGVLYDLTPLFGEDAGSVCAYGLKSRYSLLFLQREASEKAGSVSQQEARDGGRQQEARGDGRQQETRGGSSQQEAAEKSSGNCLALRLLDLRDGNITTCAVFYEETGSWGDDTEEQDFELISADPAVIYDRAEGVLYQPSSGEKAVLLPEWLRGSEITVRSGQVWLSSDRGIIYKITADGSIETAWTLPCGYGAFMPVVSGHEGRLTFATYSLKAPSERILVDVDPQTGGSEFYLSDLGSGRFSVYADGLLMGTSFRTAPKVSVCSLPSHVKKEMQLPDQLIALLRGSSTASAPSDRSFISFSTVPLAVSGSWCTFMLRNGQGCAAGIYLWDTENCPAEHWKGPSETAYAAPDDADYGQLSLEAQELGDRYGIRIVMGDNIPSEFNDYTAGPVTEPSIIKGSLSVLSNVLSLYPEGFFTDLKGKYYRDVVLYLTGPLTPINAEMNISNAGAFATESNGLMQVAFDLYDDLDPSTVIHELTHAADYRFLGEGLLDEDAWNAMNPEGFSYYFSYIDASGESYETSGSSEYTAAGGCSAGGVYFIDPYSKTYPMEDRALLMENLLAGSSPYSYCFGGEHVQEKLSWYFRFLRDTLDAGAWPASTAWEDALRKAAVKE